MIGYPTDPYDDHVQAVHALAEAGIDAPEEWVNLHARVEYFSHLGSPSLAGLADAVIGEACDTAIAALRAQALAEASALPPAGAQADHAVRTAALGRLRDIYAPHARPNYQQLATAFDAIATKFAAAVTVGDPETEAAQLISASDKQRKAFTDAGLLALQLTRSLAALRCAATLAGVSTTAPEDQIALVVDATGLHRRRVREAWKHEGGRTGRWAPLLALGATLRAAADLDNLRPYARPAPMQIKQVRVGPGIRQEPHDPEDELVGVADNG
jgi:hypothetical protein